jgi:hypothetical protein
MASVMKLAMVVMAAAVLSGCGGRGALSMQSSVGPQIVLSGSFNKVVYGYDDNNQVEIMMIEGPDEKPTQAVHIKMQWAPRAGRTPIDPSATNATIRYVIFTGEGAGVYSGAGFLFAKDYPGDDTFTGELTSSALRLYDHSESFHDRLGLAKVTGGFTAKLDDVDTQRSLISVTKKLREQLGYPAFVRFMSDDRVAGK